MLIVMAGLPGTGKSTLAERLKAELGAVVLNKMVGVCLLESMDRVLVVRGLQHVRGRLRRGRTAGQGQQERLSARTPPQPVDATALGGQAECPHGEEGQAGGADHHADAGTRPLEFRGQPAEYRPPGSGPEAVRQAAWGEAATARPALRELTAVIGQSEGLVGFPLEKLAETLLRFGGASVRNPPTANCSRRSPGQTQGRGRSPTAARMLSQRGGQELRSRSVTAWVFFIDDVDRVFGKLVKEEPAFDRSLNFTGSFGTVGNVLGHSPKTSIAAWSRPDDREYPLKRPAVWDAADRLEQGRVAGGCGVGRQTCSGIARRRVTAAWPRPDDREYPLKRPAVWDAADYLRGPRRRRSVEKPALRSGRRSCPRTCSTRASSAYRKCERCRSSASPCGTGRGWSGTVFVWGPFGTEPPVMGSTFRDPDAAAQILTHSTPRLARKTDATPCGSASFGGSTAQPPLVPDCQLRLPIQPIRGGRTKWCFCGPRPYHDTTE